MYQLLPRRPTKEAKLDAILPLLHCCVQREEADGNEKEGEYTLRIAWQYRRYLQATGSSTRSAALRDAAASTAAAGGGSSSPRVQGGAPEAAITAAGSAKKSVRIAAPEPGAAPGRLKDWAHQFDLTRGLGKEGVAKCRVVSGWQVE